MKAECATIVVLNKWDIEDTDLDFVRARAESKLRLRPKVITASAHTGRNVRRLLNEAILLADRAGTRVPTTELNRFLGDLQAAKQPPAVRGRRLRMYYMTQYEENPPRFAVQVNDKTLVTRSYAFLPGEPAEGALRAGGRPARDRVPGEEGVLPARVSRL